MLNLFGRSSSSASSSSSSSSSSSGGSPSKEQLRAWVTSLKREQRQLARQQAAIAREEQKVRAELKRTAKTGNLRACTTLAKSVLQSQKQQDKLLLAQTHINSVVLQLKTTAATVAVVGHVQRSSDIMRSMAALYNVPSIQQAAKDMGREMHRQGVMEEMINDAFDDAEVEDEAEVEVDRVLYELTDGLLGQIGEVTRKDKVEKQRVERKTAVEQPQELE